MKNEEILRADLLDIVFDNRNKAYGAYELRRNYRRRLIRALSASFIVAGALAGTFFLAKEKKLTVFNIEDPFLYAFKEVAIEKPKAPEPPKPPKAPEPKKAAAPKPVAQQQFVSKVDITKNETEVSKINTITPDVAIGSKTVDGETYKGQVIVNNPIKINEGGEVVPEAPKVDVETPRLAADVMPAYPGGIAALRKFLERNLVSPDEMEEGSIVSVKVKFIVGYDGKLKGFEIVEDGGAIYNKEVIRVLKKMPEWIPGKANGHNVSVYYTIPVKFAATN